MAQTETAESPTLKLAEANKVEREPQNVSDFATVPKEFVQLLEDSKIRVTNGARMIRTLINLSAYIEQQGLTPPKKGEASIWPRLRR